MKKKYLSHICMALALSAALLTGSTSLAAAAEQDELFIAGEEAEVSAASSSFGSAGKELETGSYRVPISLMNAANHNNASAAASVFTKNALLEVAQDGSATMTLSLRPMTVGTITDYAREIKIYQGDSVSSEKQDASIISSITTDETVVNGPKEVPTKISFAIPDQNLDGIYMNFFVDAMGSSVNAWLKVDYENAVDSAIPVTYQGTYHVEQFGEYDVNVTVTTDEDLISGLTITGENFGGKYSTTNEGYLSAAIEGMKDAFNGLGTAQKDAKSIYDVDLVSGATYSSKAIRGAVMNALNLTYEEEAIKVPSSIEPGVYSLPATYYTDVASHNLLGGEKKETILTVNEDGSMYLDMNPVSGNVNAPLYLYAFNGYYENNDVNDNLSTANAYIKSEDTDFSDDYFDQDTKIVTKVVMPLTGGLSEEYATSINLYVPAMKNLDGEMSGITFDHGRFEINAFVKLYWNDIKAVSGSIALRDLKDGVYAVDASMVQPSGSLSMSDGAIVKPVMLTKSKGSYTMTVNFKALSIGSQKGYLDKLKYFASGYSTNANNYPQGDLQDVAVVSKQAYTNGNLISDSFGSDYPDIVSFPLIDEAVDSGRIPLQVFVPVMESIMAGNGTQSVYMVLDTDTVRETTASDEAFKDSESYTDPKTLVKNATLKFAKSSMTVSYGAKAFTNKLTKVTNGKLTYKSSNTSVATVDANGKVTIKGAGKASITVSSAATSAYKAGKVSYSLTVSPGKAVLSSVKNPSKKTIKVTWKKASAIGKTTAKAKYYLQYATAKNFKGAKTIKLAGTKTAATIAKLKKGKTYYVRIRAYDSVTKKFGAYSAVKSIKIKK